MVIGYLLFVLGHLFLAICPWSFVQQTTPPTPPQRAGNNQQHA